MKGRRILAIDPTSRGFGFIVFETPDRLIDWGTRSGPKSGIIDRFTLLAREFRPHLLVLEESEAAGCRRCLRVRELLNTISVWAKNERLRTSRIPATAVRHHFGGESSATKHAIARAVAAQFPELAACLPPERKPWMSEDERMSIFDATALLLTYLARRQ